MRGVGHIVPCARARQAAQTALQANCGAHESSQAARSVVFLTGLSPQSLLLSVCAFLLRFGFRTLLIFTLYNNPAASESDECVYSPRGDAARNNRALLRGLAGMRR